MEKKWKVAALLFVIFIFVASVTVYFTAGLGHVKSLEIGHISAEGKEDGYYKGSYEYGRWSSVIEVVIRDERIVEINVFEPIKDSKSDVGQTIAERVLESQDTDIDTVTGATVDSNVYLKAIENAMDN